MLVPKAGQRPTCMPGAGDMQPNRPAEQAFAQLGSSSLLTVAKQCQPTPQHPAAAKSDGISMCGEVPIFAAAGYFCTGRVWSNARWLQAGPGETQHEQRRLRVDTHQVEGDQHTAALYCVQPDHFSYDMRALLPVACSVQRTNLAAVCPGSIMHTT